MSGKFLKIKAFPLLTTHSGSELYLCHRKVGENPAPERIKRIDKLSVWIYIYINTDIPMDLVGNDRTGGRIPGRSHENPG